MLFNFGLGLLRCGDAPHLVEGVHIERQIIELAMIVGDGAVGVSVKGHDGVYEVPDGPVVGMEDVGSILMDVDAFDILAIDIAAQVWAFVYDEEFFALLLGMVGESCAK